MNINNKVKENLYGYLFILPNLIGFLVFVAFSVLFSLVISFTDWDMLSDLSSIHFVGLQNYVNAFQDNWFLDSIINNLWFLCIVPLQMFLALIISVLLDRGVPGKKLFMSTLYLPYITSFVAVSLIWFQLLHPSDGFVNNILVTIGIADPPKWFGSSYWVKPAIAMMMTWKGMGYNIILYTAGLQNVPNQLYEAADVDGATAVRKFFSITIPMISPVNFFIFIISVINTFLMWSNIQILTQGGPGSSSTVIGYYIYKVAFEHSKMGYASSIAWVLFIIIFVITLIQWRGQKKWVNYA